MDILEPDGVLDRPHRMALRSLAINNSLFETATEEKQAIATAEMAVEAVHLLVLKHQVFARMPLGKPVRFGASGGRRGDCPPKLRGDHHQRALQQPTLGEVF